MRKQIIIAATLIIGIVAGCAPGPQQPSPMTSPLESTPSGRRAPSDSMPGQAVQPAVQPERTIKVALLLPLSGKSSALGNAMQDAAILALQDKYDSLGWQERGEARVILIPKDTAGDPLQAKRQAEQAIAEGADIVVGPVFSHVLAAVTPALRARGVPVIGFSNNQAMAAPGVYLMGFLPEQQMRRVVSYARSQGAERFAALLPNDAYGRMVHTVLQEMTATEGLQLANAIYYPPGATDLRREMTQLFGRYKDKDDEATVEEMAEPVVNRGIDALIIPEGGERLQYVVRALEKQPVDRSALMILGSGQWDVNAESIADGLQGSWFASADPQQQWQFERHFRSIYGYEPVRLASLSYDATALVATLAYAGELGEKRDGATYFTPDILTDPAGFKGPVDGIFRFLPSGKVERGLAVLEVGERGFRVVDPAPRVFASPPTMLPYDPEAVPSQSPQ